MAHRKRRSEGPAEKMAWVQAAAAAADDVCRDWPWHSVAGYGRIWVDGKDVGVHVLSCTLAHGPRPAGMVACHSCHRPICASGAHLRWDTVSSNAMDRVADGTAALGERNHKAKMSEDSVRSIRSRYASGGVTQSALAAEYGVSQGTIGFILRGETWRHVM